MKRLLVCGVALAGLAVAQQPAPRAAAQPAPMVGNLRYFTATSDGAGIAGMALASVVKGAPYAAESSTETIQTLADGNRIVNTTTGKMYRDAEGRTRFDQTSGPAGAWVPADKQFSISNIDDPVSGEHIMLNNTTKQATRFPKPMIVGDFQPDGVGSASADFTKKTLDEATANFVRRSVVIVANPATMGAGSPPPLPPPPMPVMGQVTGAGGGMGPDFIYYQKSGTGALIAGASQLQMERPKTESLGTKTIEGVLCTGTRETMTIPAGAIGNEREIQSVTERWYSTDLQMDVSRKTSDPRFGESTYKLTNVVRGEQPKSLFEVPPDYTASEVAPKMGPKLQTKQ